MTWSDICGFLKRNFLLTFGSLLPNKRVKGFFVKELPLFIILKLPVRIRPYLQNAKVDWLSEFAISSKMRCNDLVQQKMGRRMRRIVI